MAEGSEGAYQARMRTLLLLLAIPLLATFAPLAMFSPPPLPKQESLAIAPVALQETDPERRNLGGLVYLGGWVMRSNDRRFGGISAMHIAEGQVTAISDAGAVIRFALPGTGPSELSIFPLPTEDAAEDKVDRDSESLAVHGGTAWIVFEQSNEISRYSFPDWKGQASTAAAAMKEWTSNSGGEAILRLPKNRFLVFAEGRASSSTSEVVLFQGDPTRGQPKTRSLRYRPPEGYRITDAALLPDGRVLYLNRRFNLLDGMSAKLTIGPKPDLSEGAILSGVEIADFRSPITVDNMEALSVTVEQGRTIVWIASDDNFNPLQRTLLMKFALADQTTG